jgi:CxxC motif-containing protein
MNEKVITCITCPLGCDIIVKGEGDEVVSVTGHTCKRGEKYAIAEFKHPERILSSTVKVDGGVAPLVAVRSATPIPKESLFDAMALIKQVRVQAPVDRYDVILHDILGTGVDVVASGIVPKACM